MSTIPELLAPAGNATCLRAAIAAGADAVYLGLDEFNARRNADNFTLDSFEEVCDYAHLRGVKVYVTMNVEILPSELNRALQYAQQAYLAGADAFIVQDLGLATHLHRALPEAALHASTQMNIHSVAGVAAAARLGMSRVTLARELNLEEIATLVQEAAGYGMDVECFAHGALCICYSGQCLMSSLIGGRSANRGLCAQACRLPYELHASDRDEALPAPGEYLLSPRDLCSIDTLKQFMEAGVGSCKIEGRMKSADYVYEVVSVYRAALDCLAAEAEASPQERDAWHLRLEEAFSRGFTTAYLHNERGNDMMSYTRPNNRGVFVGRVTHADASQAKVACETPLSAGDIVEFWTNRGRFTATVPAGVNADATQVSIPVEGRTSKGDRVFRVRNAQTAFPDDANASKVPVKGRVVLRKGSRAYACFTCQDGTVGSAEGDVVEAARTKSLVEDDVRSHVDRLGQTPFVLTSLEIELDEGIGMGFSALHHLRAEALENLQAAILLPWKQRSAPATSAPTQIKSSTRKRNTTCAIAAWTTNPDCARAAKRAGADLLYTPLLNFRRGQAQTAGVLNSQVAQAGYPKQCIMALPTIEHDPLATTREASQAFEPWDYVRAGKPVFTDSLASTLRALDEGALPEMGPHIPLMNSASLQLAEEWGVKRVWLSPELTLGQIADLAEHSNVELGLFVSGAQELMICEHCLLMSQGPCNQNCEVCPRRSKAHKLVDRKGFEFPVVTDMLGRSHLYNGIELDALPTLPDLIDAGISAIMVDTTLMNRKETEAAVKRAVRAVDFALSEGKAIQKRPGTTTGHLFRGVM